MAEKSNAAERVNKAWPAPIRVGVIPFTGGLIIFIYAFFWPEGYGHWLGSIVRAFRETAGF